MEANKKQLLDTSVVFIGAGNLATWLAKAMHAKGYRIVQVYSRTEESARTLAEAIGASYTTDLGAVVNDAGLYISALKDDVLEALIPQMVAGREKALWVHTAGSLPMSVWYKKAERYGVLYPLQTFSKLRAVDFAQIPIFIEARRAEDLRFLHALAASLSQAVYEADSETRKGLHLAAVFASNFTNHLYAMAEELLKRYGLPFKVLLPLIDETARKVHELAPHDAQTGPAMRGDERIMELHEEMLAHDERLGLFYSILSASIYDDAHPEPLAADVENEEEDDFNEKDINCGLPEIDIEDL
ncbi:MAG: DUF2520 domain-containing protein [Prevotellaceae bacterium]|nr:DUF2520 domain-containing protein [Prevotellaceae bacterium]